MKIYKKCENKDQLNQPIDNINNIDIIVNCPFCNDEGYDLSGLKDHLLHGDCEIFNKTDISNINRMY